MLGLFIKLNSRVLGLPTTPDLRVILIITLNLHDLNLSEPSCNTRPKNIGCGSGYKVVS